MGIAVASEARYQDALRRLFPQGEYWDRQFNDPEGDTSLFVKAKAASLVRFRERMRDLLAESKCETAIETLDDWERVLTGTITIGLEPDDRRALLTSQKAGNISLPVIRELASLYGWTITNITFPFRAAFFGFSRFGHTMLASPAAFSVIYVYANAGNKTAFSLFTENYKRSCFGLSRMGQERIISPRAASAMNLYVKLSGRDIWEPFELKLEKSLLANYIPYFIYGGGI